MSWTSPSLQVRWGPYFRADATEQKAVVDMVRASLSGEGGALITLKHAVQKIASIYDIENIDAVIKEIESEEAVRTQKAIEKSTAELKALHPSDDGDETGSGTVEKKPGSASGSFGGSNAAAD